MLQASLLTESFPLCAAFESVALSHGPPDASVIVTVVDSSGTQVPIDEEAESFVLDTVSNCGEALLVR